MRTSNTNKPSTNKLKLTCQKAFKNSFLSLIGSRRMFKTDIMWFISGMSTKSTSLEISTMCGICKKFFAQFPTPLGQRRIWNNMNQWSSLVPSLNWREINFLSQFLTSCWNTLSGLGLRTNKNRMLIDERRWFIWTWMSGSTVLVILIFVFLLTSVNAGLFMIFLITSSIYKIVLDYSEYLNFISILTWHLIVVHFTKLVVYMKDKRS